jgi:hypothetical protein
MREIEPNAILVGGPEPQGGRQICAGPNLVEYRVATADGVDHVWLRSDRLERLKGFGWARVYAHVSDLEAAVMGTGEPYFPEGAVSPVPVVPA